MNFLSQIDLFFYLNFFCNDRCDFCFFSKLPPRKNVLTLADVKKVIQGITEKKIRGLVLTGGEPTLSPHFWQILDYLHTFYVKPGIIKEFDLSTNAITSADKKTAGKIARYFEPFDKANRGVKISFSFSSFSRRRLRLRSGDDKIKGVTNLAKAGGNLEGVITLTKRNYSAALDATKFILDLYAKRSKKYFSKLDYRLPYTSIIYRSADFPRLLIPFEKFFVALRKITELVSKEKVYVTFHNIPLCYIENRPEYFVSRHPPRGLAVFPAKTAGFVKRRKLFEFGNRPVCNRCVFKGRCFGIEKIYLEKYNYQELKPIIKSNETFGDQF